MIIQIKYKNIRDFYIKYFTFLNPYLKLNKNSIEVLSAYCTLYHKYKDYNKDNLYNILFSDSTSKAIQEKIGLSPIKYKRAFSTLKNKGYILDNSINTKLLHFSVKNDNKIQLEFNEEK